MTLIMDRLGTPDQLMTEGSILFLEDLDEPLYSYDRMLTHMRNTGMFDHIHGLIIGELLNIKNEEIPFGKTVDEIVLDICGDLDIPIVTNFPCGHGRFQATLPLSLPVKFSGKFFRNNINTIRISSKKGLVSAELHLVWNDVYCRYRWNHYRQY